MTKGARQARASARMFLGAAAATGLLLAGSAATAGERCEDRRIVRFGETTESIARRCGVTPGAIERQNPGLHIDGAKTGARVNVPKPALPSPRIEIRGNPAVSSGIRVNAITLR